MSEWYFSVISSPRWVQSSLSDNNAEINLGERAEKSFHHGSVEHINTNPPLSCLTGKTSVCDPMPTCLFELCNYRPASALSFKPRSERDVCDAVRSEPGTVGPFAAIYSRSQCVQAGLLSPVTVQAAAPGLGGVFAVRRVVCSTALQFGKRV